MESKNEEGQQRKEKRGRELDLERSPAVEWKKNLWGDSYSTWTAEIGKGKSLKVALDTEVRYLNIRKISLGKDIVENEENGPVYLYKTVYKTDKSAKQAKQVIGTLYSKELRDAEMKLILKNEDLELSHSWDNGSLILHGLIADDTLHAKYKFPKIDVVLLWMQLLAVKMNTEDAKVMAEEMKKMLAEKSEDDETMAGEMKNMLADKMNTEDVKVMAEKMKKLVAEKKSEGDKMMEGKMKRMLTDKMNSKDAQKMASMLMALLKHVEKENSARCH